MGAQPLSKKRGLMNRLRQVRSAALPASARMCASGTDEKPSTYAPAHTEVDKPRPGLSDDIARKPSAKGRTVHREGSLDVEEIDTKLEHYARTSAQPQGNADRDQATVEKAEAARDRESPEVAASTGSAGQGPQAPGPHLQPPDQAAEPGPSDYEAFMREAEEDDRRWAPESKGHGAPGRGREPALNSFYSNNWAARSEPAEKLAEIQESDGEDEDEDEDGSGGSDGSDATPTDSGVGPTDAGRDAAARFALPRANTDPGNRHVQFSNTGEAGERVGGRRGSGASCAQRLKSPPRPVRRQRSMMKMIADYIRLPRD